METETQAWERLSDETQKAYAAFCLYRDLGATRSLDRAYRSQTGRKQDARPSGQWRGWYERFEWKRRSEAYDAFLERKARQDKEEAYARDLESYREQQKKLAAATVNAATGLLVKAGARLKSLKAEDIPAASLPSFFRAAAAIAEAATNAEAQALGVEEMLKVLYDGNLGS